MATAFKVALLVAMPALAFSTMLTPWHVISSFLFIPDDTLGPVVMVGWTLSFEMLFYALFATALWLRIRPDPVPQSQIPQGRGARQLARCAGGTRHELSGQAPY
jgi:peptidoglycan/LPS O-acetylase OafA/YrhL